MLQLRVQIKTEAVESIENLLFSCGAVSVSYTDGASNPILEPKPGDHPLWPNIYIYALFTDEDLASLTLKALQNASNVGSQVMLEQIDEYGWQEKFQQQFSAVQYGPNLWVYPSWQENPAPDGISLRLDPGLAFGTGHHPTTNLCMQWLALAPLEDKTLIDFGCGSGILALAACKLGAQHVYAVDIDPQAILATTDNSANNTIGPDQLSVGNNKILNNVTTDIIIANILAAPILELRDTFLHHLCESGTLVLSGILSSQSKDIINHYSAYFEDSSLTTEDDWACLTLTRKH